MKNNEKGITLVALVITIIVLLILAGVTIMALSGDNGILNRASQSKVSTNIANVKDAFTTVAAEGITEYYNSKYVAGDNTLTDSIGKTVADKIYQSSTSKTYCTGSAATASGTSYQIVTNVKDADGAALTATIDKDGKITWTNDKMTK